MKINTICCDKAEASARIASALKRWEQQGDAPSFLAVHHQSGALDAAIKSEIAAACRAVHVASSSGGIMSNAGADDVGILAISDPMGSYGTSCQPIDRDAFEAAKTATATALQAANRLGEAPDLIWLSITPGQEEAALKGIESVIGTATPIIGGSAADDHVAGEWSVGDAEKALAQGITVSVLFTSTPTHFAYQNGYEPTGHSGVATKVDGRTVHEIDGKPAAEVYRSWTDNTMPIAHTNPVNILANATLWPLGRKVRELADTPHYLLAHPCTTHPCGSIETFAEIEQGERLTQMTGTKGALARRAGRVADFTLTSAGIPKAEIAGALMVYCGGCRMAVQNEFDDVYKGVDHALGHAPFMGVFTFGEQGPWHAVGNKHGNLMISCIAFTTNS